MDSKEDKKELPELGSVELIDYIALEKLYVDRDFYRHETRKLRKQVRYFINRLKKNGHNKKKETQK